MTNDALLSAAKAVLYHDERGQGIGYAEAMRALAIAVAKAERPREASSGIG